MTDPNHSPTPLACGFCNSAAGQLEPWTLNDEPMGVTHISCFKREMALLAARVGWPLPPVRRRWRRLRRWFLGDDDDD